MRAEREFGKEKAPSDAGDRVVTGGDFAFMNDAAPGGMAEVELGRMAAKQAQSNEVKQFGARMVTDHTKAGDELEQSASQKKVTLPAEITPKQKEAMEKLAKLKGADFDRAYVMEMVADHEKDVTAFTATANGATDADLKDYAAKTLPTLKRSSEDAPRHRRQDECETQIIKRLSNAQTVKEGMRWNR